jgi:Family of unknown function (DUF6876)
MKTPSTKHELAQFTGTELWYRHGHNRKVVFTDGAKYVADRAEAYWLLDEIALTQPDDKRVGAEELQVWKLTVNPDCSAELVCEDGNNTVMYRKAIPFTDFPSEGITLCFQNNTIFLPSER